MIKITEKLSVWKENKKWHWVETADNDLGEIYGHDEWWPDDIVDDILDKLLEIISNGGNDENYDN